MTNNQIKSLNRVDRIKLLISDLDKRLSLTTPKSFGCNQNSYFLKFHLNPTSVIGSLYELGAIKKIGVRKATKYIKTDKLRDLSVADILLTESKNTTPKPKKITAAKATPSNNTGCDLSRRIVDAMMVILSGNKEEQEIVKNIIGSRLAA